MDAFIRECHNCFSVEYHDDRSGCEAPTPATAAATATANVAAVAASLMSDFTTTVTGSLPAAAAAAATRAFSLSSTSDSYAFPSSPSVTAENVNAANVATPSTGQKRKARP